MNIKAGEIDEAQLLAILGRYNHLSSRAPFDLNIEGREVIQRLADDLATMLISYGFRSDATAPSLRRTA